MGKELSHYLQNYAMQNQLSKKMCVLPRSTLKRQPSTADANRKTLTAKPLVLFAFLSRTEPSAAVTFTCITVTFCNT